MLPNIITLSRLFFTALFVAVLSVDFAQNYALALWLFIIAAISDWLDGKIARASGTITSFGKLADPIADKILIAAALVMLCSLQPANLPAWMVVVVLLREFAVTGLRLITAADGTVLAADQWGKVKTILQISCVIYWLLLLAQQQGLMWQYLRWIFQPDFIKNGTLGVVLNWLMLIATIQSGWSYFWQNRKLISFS